VQKQGTIDLGGSSIFGLLPITYAMCRLIGRYVLVCRQTDFERAPNAEFRVLIRQRVF